VPEGSRRQPTKTVLELRNSWWPWHTTLGAAEQPTADHRRQLGIPCVVAIEGLDAVVAETMGGRHGNLGTVTGVKWTTAISRQRTSEAGSAASDERAKHWSGTGDNRRRERVPVLAKSKNGAADTRGASDT